MSDEDLKQENARLREYLSACRKWIEETVANCSVASDPPKEADYLPED